MGIRRTTFANGATAKQRSRQAKAGGRWAKRTLLHLLARVAAALAPSSLRHGTRPKALPPRGGMDRSRGSHRPADTQTVARLRIEAFQCGGGGCSATSATSAGGVYTSYENSGPGVGRVEILARCLPRTLVRVWHGGATRVQGGALYSPSPAGERGVTISWATLSKNINIDKPSRRQPESWKGGRVSNACCVSIICFEH